MTTLNKIAEQVKRLLGKYTDDSDIDKRELAVSIHQQLGGVISESYLRDKNLDVQNVDGSLVYRFEDVDVKEKGDERYCELPASFVSLPHGLGIQQVKPDKGEAFRQVPQGFKDLYEGLDSGSLQNRTGYYVEGDRIYFVNYHNESDTGTVDIYLVAPLDGIDDDSTINIPSDMEQQVINRVTQLYAPILQRPTDESNDAIDKA